MNQRKFKNIGGGQVFTTMDGIPYVKINGNAKSDGNECDSVNIQTGALEALGDPLVNLASYRDVSAIGGEQAFEELAAGSAFRHGGTSEYVKTNKPFQAGVDRGITVAAICIDSGAPLAIRDGEMVSVVQIEVTNT